jgi:DNA-binding SARP family transcriptional activator
VPRTEGAARRSLGQGPLREVRASKVPDADPETGRRGNAEATEPAAEASDSADSDPWPPAQAPSRVLQLSILGRIRLKHLRADGDQHADLSESLAPKHREVLTYLALHPDGVRREALAADIWPDAPRDRPYNSFHATLSQLRRALRAATHDEQTEVTVHFDGHYALDREQIDVDLWQVQNALQSAQAEKASGSVIDRVLSLYGGDLGAGLTAEWLEASRESLRRDVLDLISAQVRTERDTHPEEALTLLERARSLDRYNESVYRSIGRLQARLGRPDAVPRTFALLTRTLAEIDEQPSPETAVLFGALQHQRAAQGTARQ